MTSDLITLLNIQTPEDKVQVSPDDIVSPQNVKQVMTQLHRSAEQRGSISTVNLEHQREHLTSGK